MYFIGRGSILVADRNTDGTPKELTDVGEVPVFEFNVTTEFADNFESKSAIGRQDLHVATQQSGAGTMQLKEPTADNLALALYGTKNVDASATITNRPFPAGLTAGKTYQLPGAIVQASSVVITDSAGSPVTLVAGTDYEVDAVYGTIVIGASGITGKTQPFKISCSVAEVTSVSMLTKRASEKFILFKGINIADGDKPVLVELYRASLEPASKLPMKGGKDVAEYEVKFMMLDDSTKPEDPVLGRYGRYRILA